MPVDQPPAIIQPAETGSSKPWSVTAVPIALVKPLPTYLWKPQENITAYELALAMPILIGRDWHQDYGKMIEALPPEARRHFEKEPSR